MRLVETFPSNNQDSLSALERMDRRAIEAWARHAPLRRGRTFMRRLIVCCDGTWNKPGSADSEDERQPDTNVVRLLRLIAPTAPADPEVISQIVYYQRGVGTAKDWFDRLFGGLFGLGVSDRIRSAYGFLVDNYVEGDEIYLFGFSRGAFIARRIAAMISTVGLLEKSDMRYFRRVWNAFTRCPPGTGEFPDEKLKELLQSRPQQWWQRLRSGEPVDPEAGSPTRRPNIRFVGVWDTVGAYGIPGVQSIWQKLHVNYVGFADRTLPKRVVFARHALARHEHRKFFVPNLWNADPKMAEGKPRVKQVWFDGAHSNVGGGYRDDPLPYLALTWMIDEAVAAGLHFERLPKAVRSEIDDLKAYTAAKVTNSYWEFRRNFLWWPVAVTLLAIANSVFPGWIRWIIRWALATSTDLVSLAWVTRALQQSGPSPTVWRMITGHPWVALFWLAWIVSFLLRRNRKDFFKKVDTLVHWSVWNRSSLGTNDRQREEKKPVSAEAYYP